MSTIVDRLLWTLFGDRVGLAIFLGALVFFAMTWRTNFLLNDNFTITNTMVGLSEGHLYIDRAFYKSTEVPTGGAGTLASPGTTVHDGRLYGENYGQLFLALPLLFGLKALAAVADLRIAVAGIWCLLFLGFCVQVGTIFDRRRFGILAGCGAALALFVVNVAVAPDLDVYWIAFMSLHSGSMVAAGFVGVLLHRLVGGMYSRRAGAFAGSIAVLATPVGFWAAIPMRHATTAVMAMASMYWFYRSRSTDSAAWATRFRALAYAPVGLTAWIFSPEGLILLVALVVVDPLTARSNAPRRLLPVGAVLALSLVPFFLTNLIVSGNPLRPPLLLDGFTGQQTVELAESADVNFGDGSSGGDAGGPGPDDGGSAGGGDGSGSGERTEAFVAAATSVPSLVALFLSKIAEALGIFVTQPERVYHTFVRTGFVDRATLGNGEPINLALLEAMPVAGVLVALPFVAVDRFRTVIAAGTPTASVRSLPRRIRAAGRDLSPERSTDLFAVAYVTFLVLSYMPTLPLHAQYTVRYLVPGMPIVLYGAFRMAAVRRPLVSATDAFVWTYAGGLLIGGQVAVAYLAFVTATMGEMVQFHALLSLALAAPLAVWVVVSTTERFEPDPRGGAVLFGLVAAATTLFLLLAGTQYFTSPRDLVIPVVRTVAREVSLV
ncbi:hypothetical protein BRD00_13190 [Halobacteriales archaeon QS_8_69_26]|nr:MAG: hypothetical protein BRD00_13190 [Halobacteriales archaeon QS_8_69_26]